MNETKYIFENYRKCIVEDKVATAILADLYFNLPQKDEDLIKKFPKENIRLNLAELHKVSLLRKMKNDFWGISDLGKTILLRLDMAQFILDCQFEKLRLNKIDKTFLKSCIRSQTHFKEDYPNLISSFIKTLQKSVQLDNSNTKKKDELIKDTLYAFIVGLDNNIKSLDLDDYPDFIFSTLQYIDKQNWLQYESEIIKNKKQIVKECSQARSNLKLSNSWFIKPELTSSANKNLVVNKLIRCRLANPFINHEIDNDLKKFFSYMRKDEDNKILYEILDDEFTNLEFKIRDEKKDYLNYFNLIRLETEKRQSDKNSDNIYFKEPLFSSLLSDEYLQNLNKNELSNLLVLLEETIYKVKLYFDK